jgi:CYTH domain-containing protein
VIENGGDFAAKLHRLDKDICRMLGIPTPIEIEKKYLCPALDPEAVFKEKKVHYEKIEIEQIYLGSPEPETELRVRKRGQNGSFVYFETKKRPVAYATRLETERIISKEQWQYAQQFRDPTTQMIRKDRFCFVYEHQYFELDQIKLKDGVIFVLEVELTEEADKIKIPDFLKVGKDVTGDPDYSNRALATLRKK